jgi:catechol 2,3-dioxygenase-like lactoylglutathione lyase family enzyme
MTLQHVSLETRAAEVEAEVAFWALLGFARVAVPEGLRERAVWMASGGTQVHLLFAEEPVVPVEGHVAVVCAAYSSTVAVLRAAGFVVEPRAEHWGAARAYVRSPGGHRVEVMAAGPPGGA